MNAKTNKEFYEKLVYNESLESDPLELFGQFIGNWEWCGFDYDAEGNKSETTGRWIFETVLNGKAIQDIFTFDNPDFQKDGKKFMEYGTTIRYPVENDIWKSVWVGPMNKVIRIFDAKSVNNEIVLNSKDEKDDLIRWIFSNIRRNSFHWRGEKSSDNGKTWFLYEELNATRKDVN